MHRPLTLALLLATAATLYAGPALRDATAQLPRDGQTPRAQPVQATASPRVEALLAAMTLEEKVGQMTQLTLAAVAAQGGPSRDSVRIDPAKLRQAIVQRHVGSLLNVVGGSLSIEGWHRLIGEVQGMAMRETRLGIPVVYGIDFVHGANYTRGGTIFPHNLGMAATFDAPLSRRAGEITGDEAMASGLPWNFAPVLDVGRNPVWPRFYETFGEDPTVAAVLGTEQVLGMQRGGRVAATLKHYLAYSASRTGHDRTPVELSVRGVRENYLPPFAAAVRAGARAVMVNSAEIDGEPVHASHYWLTEVLRDELGFTGVVVTDWEDIYYLHTRHRVAPSIKDAVRMAIGAGVDMSMTPNDFRFTDALIELVREGAVPESRIDQSVRRILTLKEELGLFDHPLPDPALRAGFATDQAAQVARRAARESITLLRNEGGILPLKPDARIFVTGPAAQSMTALNGGWTDTWQGTDASQFPQAPRTVLEAILRRGRNVRFSPGSGFTEPGDVDEAARLADDADVAVVVIGEDAYAEGVGDVADLTLPEAQLRLVQAVQATGTPTVLVLVEGRPRIIRPVVDAARAVVLAYWPGMHGGEAVAEVLFGETNPSGRLPFTYPRFPNELLTYDHKFTETLSPRFDGHGFDPQWPFGHGLSYTTFAYRDLRMDAARMDSAGRIRVQVTVQNTGGRAGDETVLLYTRQHYASRTPYTRRLRGFERVSLAPGESRTVAFLLAADDLRFAGTDGRMVLEPGEFDVMVGGLTATFQVTAGPTTTGGR